MKKENDKPRLTDLVRNTTPDGRCKYAIVRLDKLKSGEASRREWETNAINAALKILEAHSLVEYGEKGSVDEFFVMKLKDYGTAPALAAYADCMEEKQLTEYGRAIDELARRSYIHPSRRLPD